MSSSRAAREPDGNFTSFRRCGHWRHHVLIFLPFFFITMSRRSSATATKRRHVNGANSAPNCDWLSVFAAASMFIGDDVMEEGSLFPIPRTDKVSDLNPYGTPVTTKLTAKDFGPIILHDPTAFYQLIGKLYAALRKEQQTKNYWAGDKVDPALCPSVSVPPTRRPS